MQFNTAERVQFNSRTDLVRYHELVLRLIGPGNRRKRDAPDVVALAPGTSHSRHDGALHRDLEGVNERVGVHKEAPCDAAGLSRLVPHRVEDELRRAGGLRNSPTEVRESA